MAGPVGVTPPHIQRRHDASGQGARLRPLGTPTPNWLRNSRGVFDRIRLAEHTELSKRALASGLTFRSLLDVYDTDRGAGAHCYILVSCPYSDLGYTLKRLEGIQELKHSMRGIMFIMVNVDGVEAMLHPDTWVYCVDKFAEAKQAEKDRGFGYQYDLFATLNEDGSPREPLAHSG